jgi:hypothetical protein
MTFGRHSYRSTPPASQARQAYSGCSVSSSDGMGEQQRLLSVGDNGEPKGGRRFAPFRQGPSAFLLSSSGLASSDLLLFAYLPACLG